MSFLNDKDSFLCFSCCHCFMDSFALDFMDIWLFVNKDFIFLRIKPTSYFMKIRYIYIQNRFKVIRKFFLKHKKSFRWHLGDYEKHIFSI